MSIIQHLPPGLLASCYHAYCRWTLEDRQNPFALETALLSDVHETVRHVSDALHAADEDPRRWMEILMERHGNPQVVLRHKAMRPLTDRSDDVIVEVDRVMPVPQMSPELWLVSMLWTVLSGRRLDSQLPTSFYAGRFHRGAQQHGSRSPRIFKPMQGKSGQWRKWARSHEATAHERRSRRLRFAVVRTDIRSFYPSVAATPSAIVAEASHPDGVGLASNQLDQFLAQSLDCLHESFATALHARADTIPIEHRPHDSGPPLPIGLPSSIVLANLALLPVHREMTLRTDIRHHAFFVDDMQFVIDDLGEMPPDNPSDDPNERLRHRALWAIAPGSGPSEVPGFATPHGFFGLNIEKSQVALFHPGSTPIVHHKGVSDLSWMSPVDDYASDVDDPGFGFAESEWTLKAIVHAAPRSSRDARRLRDQIRAIIGVAVAGCPEVEVKERFLTQVLGRLEPVTLAAIAPNWDDLALLTALALDVEDIRALVVYISALTLRPLGEISNLGAGVEDLALSLSAWRRVALALALAPLGEGESRDAIMSALPDEERDAIDQLRTRARTKTMFDLRHMALPLGHLLDLEGNLVTPSNPWDTLFGSHIDGDPVALLEQARLEIAVVPAPLTDFLLFDELHKSYRDLARAPEIREDVTTRLQELFVKQSAGCVVSPPLRRRPPAREADVESVEGRRLLKMADEPRRNVVAIPCIHVDEHDVASRLDTVRRSMSASIKRRADIWNITTQVHKSHADLTVFPEWSVPFFMVRRLLATFDGSDRSAVLPLSPLRVPSPNGDGFANLLVEFLRSPQPNGWPCALSVRAKMHLARPELEIARANGITPLTGTVRRISAQWWKGARFGTMLCLEAADISLRSAFASGPVVLAVPTWNRDVDYFDAIFRTTARELYCALVSSNTAEYRGAGVYGPKKQRSAFAAGIHGSATPAIVTYELPIAELLRIRRTRIHGGEYKPLPPGSNYVDTPPGLAL